MVPRFATLGRIPKGVWVLGGVSLAGGKGSMVGTALGVLILSTLLNGMRLQSVSTDYMNIARDTPLKKAIYACDELVGFIGACVKVRPTKKLVDLPVESVVKKLKDKAFARSVDRSYVYGGAEAIGRPLAEHVGFLIDALIPVADEIGL